MFNLVQINDKNFRGTLNGLKIAVCVYYGEFLVVDDFVDLKKECLVAKRISLFHEAETMRKKVQTDLS